VKSKKVRTPAFWSGAQRIIYGGKTTERAGKKGKKGEEGTKDTYNTRDEGLKVEERKKEGRSETKGRGKEIWLRSEKKENRPNRTMKKRRKEIVKGSGGIGDVQNREKKKRIGKKIRR